MLPSQKNIEFSCLKFYYRKIAHSKADDDVNFLIPKKAKAHRTGIAKV